MTQELATFDSLDPDSPLKEDSMQGIKERRPVIQYVREKDKTPVGVVVVYKSNAGYLKVGYSKCNPVDRFDKTFGLHLAMQRSVLVEDVDECYFSDAPTGLAPVIKTTIEKARRYFSPTPAPKAKSRKRK